MDPSTITAYALAYLATMGTVILMFLPAILSLVLLLLMGGAVHLVILVLRLTAIGLFRSVKALTGGLDRKAPSPRERRQAGTPLTSVIQPIPVGPPHR